MNRDNETWISHLGAEGEVKEAALQDLRKIISAGLPYAISKWLDWSDPRFAALIEEATQETVLRVLDRMHTFEGRSQFTTWVHTIAVRVALTELRRAKWRDVSLEQILQGKEIDDEPREIADESPSAEDLLESKEMMKMLHNMMEGTLTEKQRTALMAVAVHGMPLEEVAERMDTNRNALYKLLHDARVKLKMSFERQGLSPSDVLASFER